MYEYPLWVRLYYADSQLSAGFTVSRNVLSSLVKRYGGKRKQLSFDAFVIAVSRLLLYYSE